MCCYFQLSSHDCKPCFCTYIYLFIYVFIFNYIKLILTFTKERLYFLILCNTTFYVLKLATMSQICKRQYCDSAATEGSVFPIQLLSRAFCLEADIWAFELAGFGACFFVRLRIPSLSVWHFVLMVSKSHRLLLFVTGFVLVKETVQWFVFLLLLLFLMIETKGLKWHHAERTLLISGRKIWSGLV